MRSTKSPNLELIANVGEYYVVRCFYVTVTVRSTTIITDYVGIMII
jgi:hypothetical protein